MRAGWEWTFLRCCLASAWLTTVLWISIPDYPYQWPIWYWFAYDPNGYLHEIWYASGVFVGLITLTYFWQPILDARAIFTKVVRRIEKDL